MPVSVQPTAPPAAAYDAAVPDAPIYRLSVAQYHAMADHGILNEDDPVELLEGWLVRKMTKHPPHSLTTLLVRRALERLLADRWYVNAQEPITLSDSEPEPDVLVARGRPLDFRHRHPGPEEVVLVVEVADASLAQDRGPKKRTYARAGIPVYWIANLPERRFEVYTEPTGPTTRGPAPAADAARQDAAPPPDYRQRQEYGEADEILVVLDGVEVGRLPVRDLLA
jgi:Uma2 family endonuclease